MATYSIAEVETLTGIQAHTLRIWERRYDLIKAKRTETKIRYYDDDQLKLLLNVSILLNSGFRISKIDKLSKGDIDDLVFESMNDHGATKAEGDIQALVVAMLNLDEGLFDEVFQKYLKEYGILETVDKLVYPFLFQVGLLWGTNRAMPAQEHFVSNLIRQKMFSEIEKLPAPNKNAPSLVLFMPEGEHHELGLLLGYYIAKQIGYKTYYLGTNVPSKDVIKVVNEANSVGSITVIVLWREEYQHQLEEITSRTSKPILISGIPKEHPIRTSESYVPVNNPAELIRMLQELKKR